MVKQYCQEQERKQAQPPADLDRILKNPEQYCVGKDQRSRLHRSRNNVYLIKNQGRTAIIKEYHPFPDLFRIGYKTPPEKTFQT